MCKAHVLRFRCGHGVLMSLETCRIGPCPVIKTTGQGLPQQPYRCYNCQHKAQNTSPHSNILRPVSSRTSTSSIDSFTSNSSQESMSPISPVGSYMPAISHPLPNVAIQPAGCVRMCLPGSGAMTIGSTRNKHFSFACRSSSHIPTPHYTDLPGFLPHQDHPCPPCQLENLRAQAETDAVRSARSEFPHLRGEMLVHGGRAWDPETMSLPTCDAYVDEKRTEERQMWHHVTRKWTQDLKKARVLVAEEDGLGLYA